MRRPSALRLALTAAVLATTVVAGGAVASPAPPVPSPLQVQPPTNLLGPRTSAPADLHVARRPVSSRVKAALGAGGELRGIDLNNVDLAGRAFASTIADFPRMAAEGINTVSIYVYLYLPDMNGNTVSTGPGTPSDTVIQLVTRAAQASGLAVHLMPVLRNNTDGSWQGYYLPTSVPAFFASYTAQLDHYADLAQSLGMTLFYLGAEDVYLESFVAQWRALAKSVRRHYSGALSYMTIPLTAPTVKFWDAVDLAAVSAYFSMGEDARPTYERFLAAWREAHIPTVNKILKAIKGRPLIYAETGYNSQAGSFTHPNDPAQPGGQLALQAQADGYRALLDTLAKTAGVYGVSWWYWASGTTVNDQGYSPAGKPAECVLAQHWSTDANIRALASQPLCGLSPAESLLNAVPRVP
ncbi:MAG: hypothetical protein JWO12_2903 [Frankiales bacterium]|nr:hypothetical protein [Frankiales bacterium]